MKASTRANGLAAICLLFAACGAEHPVHYYTINYPAAPASTMKPDGIVLLVGRIVAPEALEDSRIHYRSGSNEAGAYEFQRWTERPAMMVRDLLIQKLRASGKFRQVQESSSAVAGDYLIRGKLFDFSEVDNPAMQTRVSLHLELADRKTGLVLWDRQYNRDEPVNGHAMADVVSSLDHNLQQVIADSATDIESFLSNRK